MRYALVALFAPVSRNVKVKFQCLFFEPFAGDIRVHGARGLLAAGDRGDHQSRPVRYIAREEYALGGGGHDQRVE